MNIIDVTVFKYAVVEVEDIGICYVKQIDDKHPMFGKYEVTIEGLGILSPDEIDEVRQVGKKALTSKLVC